MTDVTENVAEVIATETKVEDVKEVALDAEPIGIGDYLDKPTKVYKFKGSVFVTFQKREQCDEFMKKEDLKFKDAATPLVRLWQDAYYISKKDEREALKQKKHDDKPVPKITFPTGAVIYFEGYSETVTRELIKEAVIKFDAEVAYIDFTKGDKNGYIRLTEENAAKTLIEKLEDNKLKLENGEEATVRLIEGTEETEYLAKQVEQMLTRRNNSNHKGGRGGRQGGGRFHSRKRSSANDSSSTPNKKVK